MKAVLKQVRISPKKANLIAGLVRGKNAQEAQEFLKFLPKKGAKIISKVINSAVANAVNNKNQEKESLFISEIIVNKASTYKRSLPKARGRAVPIFKYNSHITVIVNEQSKPIAKEASTKENQEDKNS